MAVIVRKFACLAPIKGEREAIEILFIRNQLWNQLVETFNKYRDEAETLRQSENVDYGRLNQRYVDVDERVAELIVRKKAAKSKASLATADDRATIDVDIATARAEKTAIAIELKTARSVAKTARKEGTDAVWKRFNDEQKRLCHASGLWWGNHETVVEAFENARKKLSTGSAINFHRFDGSGILRVRESQGGRPISEAINGELAYIRLDPMPAAMPARSARGELHRARHILTMRIHVGRDEAGKRAPVDIALPVIQHRAFEPSLFKFATLRREREGSQFKWSVTFTCTTSETINVPLADIPARLAGINFGWRSTPDGLRIATIVDAQGQV